ncbi:MAG: transcription antitermination factor NusB [Nitriliruptoraceae bacterium]
MDGFAGQQTPKRAARDPHRSREQALKILFQADMRGVDARDVLAEALNDQDRSDILDDPDAEAPPIDGATIGILTRELVVGVVENLSAIDAQIAYHARGWQIHRMPAVDRTVLRLATFELIDGSTSPAVVINEAIEFAKHWSTADSGRYVNGVLESVRKSVADGGILAVEPEGPSADAASTAALDHPADTPLHHEDESAHDAPKATESQ